VALSALANSGPLKAAKTNMVNCNSPCPWAKSARCSTVVVGNSPGRRNNPDRKTALVGTANIAEAGSTARLETAAGRNSHHAIADPSGCPISKSSSSWARAS